MLNNHAGADSVARAEELANLLRLMVGRVARQLMVAVPPSKRSDAETYFLKDCMRDRRVPSAETLSLLLEIGSRAETPHVLSEALRQMEIGIAPIVSACVFEASEAEQEVDGAFDMAQLKLRDASPARLQHIVDLGPKMIQSVRRLVDAASRKLSLVGAR